MSNLKGAFLDSYVRQEGSGSQDAGEYHRWYRYSVTGPLSELNDYILFRASFRNIDVDKVTRDDKGNPLFHVNVTKMRRSKGVVPGKFIKISHFITSSGQEQYAADLNDQLHKDELEVMEMSKTFEAEQLAKIRFNPSKRSEVPTTPKQDTDPKKDEPKKEPLDVLDEAVSTIGAGLPVEHGNEKLGD